MFKMPTKLISTMGIELTFVPGLTDAIIEQVPSLSDYDKRHIGQMMDGTRGYMYQILQMVLREKKVEVFEVSTDPDCVEVPTNPFSSGVKLMESVRAVHKAAEICQLYPYSTFTRGGGAHIHVGKVGNTISEKKAVVAHAQAWLAANPWFAWAHAIYNDSSNANPLCKEDLVIKTNPHKRYEDAFIEMRRAEREITAAKNSLLSAERDMHTAHGWEVEQRVPDYYDAEYYRRSMMRAQIGFARTVVACVEALAQWQRAMENDTALRTTCINTWTSKNKAIVDRADTLEFRCYKMPWDANGHKKQIALTDAIIRVAVQRAKETDKLSYNMLTAVEINSMKYKEAARGFNSMLEELGFDREDFKEERVNIALRFRKLRGMRATMAARCGVPANSDKSAV